MNLAGLFSWVSGAISGGVGTLASYVVSGFSTLFGNIFAVANVLQNFIEWAKKAIGALVGFLTALWNWLRNGPLKGVIDKLLEIYQKLRTWLKAVLRIIDRYRQLLNRNFQLYIKPILDFIQRMRRVLFLFRLLGFKWAQRLDAKLQDIENRISFAFLQTLRELNTLADWVNFIIDPFALIDRNLFLGSIWRSIQEIWALIWGIQYQPLTAAQTKANDTLSHLYYRDQQMQRIRLRQTVGVLPEDEDNWHAVRDVFLQLGYTPTFPP